MGLSTNELGKIKQGRQVFAEVSWKKIRDKFLGQGENSKLVIEYSPKFGFLLFIVDKK